MKQIKLLIVASLLTFSAAILGAQDIHFSQFYMSPLNLNPAMTGVMNCNIRLVANYRNQWASVLRSNSFRTYSVSYDQRIPVGRYDYLGIGGTFWGDRAGEADFATLTGKLSFSYSKRMGGYRERAQYLVVGAEAGAAQRSIDFLNLKWGTQHDNRGGFDPTLPSQENKFDRDNFLFADLAAGLLWFMVFDEGTNFYVGGAFHHLNRSNQSFVSPDNPLVTDGTVEEDLIYSRYTMHMGGELRLNPKVGLLPGIIYMNQGPSYQLNAGASLKFFLGNAQDQQSFQIGLWTRIASELDQGFLTDAAIISTRFDFNNLSLGFSYDINLSPLQAASNSQGSFEFGMIYKICGMQRKNVYCPDF